MTRQEILAALSVGDIDIAKAEGLLIAAQARPKYAVPKLSFKVSPKGALSVYHLHRLPVTLYPNQWERIFAAVPEMQAFIEEHKDEFSPAPLPKPKGDESNAS